MYISFITLYLLPFSKFNFCVYKNTQIYIKKCHLFSEKNYIPKENAKGCRDRLEFISRTIC